MRFLTRMDLGLIGLALIVPTAVWADPPPSRQPAGQKTRSKPARLHKEHLCAQCQWAEVRAKGINVPPPPVLPQGGVPIPGSNCDRCGAATCTTSLPQPVGSATPPPPMVPAVASVAPMATAPVMGGMVAPGNQCMTCMPMKPVVMAPNGMQMAAVGGAMPGRAIAGGAAPGYAAVSGTVPLAEPMPIGVIQGQHGYQNPGAPAGAAGMPMPGGRPGPGAGRPGSSDPSVIPSSFTADPYVPGGRNRPHIISHLFGLDTIGRRGREDRERRERETHAAISYQPQNTAPSELPASMVYGR